MSSSPKEVKALNNDGSISKTKDRKLKPISFTLSNIEDSKILEKIERFTYGCYFKNIANQLSEEEIKTIGNSQDKSHPVIPVKGIEKNIKSGLLSIKKIASLIIKTNKVDQLLGELKNFISDDLLLSMAKDRGLKLNDSNTAPAYTSVATIEDDAMHDVSLAASTKPEMNTTMFTKQQMQNLHSIVIKMGNLPDNTVLDPDYIYMVVNENPDILTAIN